MIATIILLVIMFLDLGYALAKHGEPKKNGKYNFWTRLVGVIITLVLYYYAGMFDKFN